MVVAGAAQVIVDTTAALIVFLALAGALATWTLGRRVRRRVRRWRAAWSLRPLRGAAVVTAIASLPVSDPRWWVAQRDRHELWRAVCRAERAVQAARNAQAPIGELPFLVRRLRDAARSVDGALRADSRRAGAARRQLRALVDTADDIQRAAVDALMSVAEPAASGVAEAVRVEVRALAHGLAAAGSAAGRSRLP